MEPIQRIQDFEHLKILADSRRLTILRLLMAGPATLSQLGLVLDEHPARVRHHLKQLESAGLVELVDTRVVRGFVEKYYRAKAHAFLLHEVILPHSPNRDIITALGSHDMAFERLVQHLHQRKRGAVELLVLPVGSLEGLIALRQGIAQLAGCHLLDAESGEYNLPYIQHLFPDREMTLITLAHREQGLIVQPGNPHQIRNLEDLTRADLVMVNRNRGSGTRLWLDHQLERLSISPQSLQGYEYEVSMHTAVAAAVQQDTADVGLGLLAAARQFELDFIPLFRERFDLVVPKERVDDRSLMRVFNYLVSGEFRRTLDELGGYETSHTGEQINP